MSRNFRLYTKTFGGKIWTNLHKVSPDNVFGKKILEHYLVQKTQDESANFPSYFKNFKSSITLSNVLFPDSFFFFYLHEIMFPT